MGSYAMTVTSGLREFTSRQRSLDDDEMIYISRSFHKKRIPYIFHIYKKYGYQILQKSTFYIHKISSILQHNNIHKITTKYDYTLY